MEIAGIKEQEPAVRLLLGDGGYARKFIDGPAKPFVARGLREGFHPVEVMGQTIPFSEPFLTFFTQGISDVRRKAAAEPLRESYPVSIEALPTDANREAIVKPHLTKLEMHCGTETLTLNNLNYPVKETFAWVPNKCELVDLAITVGDVVLRRRYSGEFAFPRFLQDFAAEGKIFYPHHFPDEKANLKRLGVQYIKVNYRFKGHGPLIALLGSARSSVPRVPEEIVRCWDR